jgi:rhomboid protease GluP
MTPLNESPIAYEPTPDELFRQNLFESTPVAFVTPTLVAINVLVFIAMVVSGLSITDPATSGLIRWGADFGPLTTHGQWWRTLTAAFVHIGIVHIGMNMWVLYSVGPFVERLYGNAGYLVLYLLAGIGGNLVSLAWMPHIVAAGASGAVFGVYGALLGFLLRQRRTIPPERLKVLLQNAAIFVVFNLFYGLKDSSIDMGAHLGGFGTGFLAGCALALPLTPELGAARMRRALIVALCGAVLLVGAATRLPVVDDLNTELTQFETLETSLFEQYNDAATKLERKELTTGQFADLVDTKLVPPFRDELAKMSRMHFADRQRDVVSKIRSYVSLRADGWAMIAEGVRKGDDSIISAGRRKSEAANLIVSKPAQ